MVHDQAIMKAIQFIEEHLTEPLDSTGVAKQTHYSPFHFHILFSKVIGMSVKKYIRHRRLTHAAYELATTTNRIIDIAFKYGFQSQEAFTRSFKQLFGITPKSYRFQKPYITYLSKISDVDVDYLYQNKAPTPHIRSRSAFYVIGLEVTLDILGSPNREAMQHTIPDIWDIFLQRKQEIKCPLSPHVYGISLPHTDGVHFVYLACMEVDENMVTVPNGMVKREIAAGAYTVFSHDQGKDRITTAIKYLYANWNKKSNFCIKDFPIIEVYNRSDQGQIEILLPVLEADCE